MKYKSHPPVACSRIQKRIFIKIQCIFIEHMILNMIFYLLFLASNTAAVKYEKDLNLKAGTSSKAILLELRSWLTEIVEKPFPPNCQEQFLKDTGSNNYVVKKLSCKKVEGRSK